MPEIQDRTPLIGRKWTPHCGRMRVIMSSELAEILSGKPFEETAPEKPASADLADAVDKVDKIVEKEEEPESGEETEETPSSDEKEEPWTKKSALAERKKRQESEKKVKALEEELATLKQPKEEVKRPDALDDPEGALAHVEKTLRGELWKEKFTLTQEIMREKHEDYEQLETHFSEMVKESPDLLKKFVEAKNPAKFAYDTAKKDLNIQKFSDPDYEKNLEEELRKKILAEIGEKPEAAEAPAEKPKVKLPPSFANAASAKSGDKFVEDKPLDELFPPLHKR